LATISLMDIVRKGAWCAQSFGIPPTSQAELRVDGDARK
jgi:hypothetical protein